MANSELKSVTPSAPFASRMTAPARYSLAVLACVLTTAAASALHAYLDAANTVMLFLLAVVLVAVYLGRGPAILSAVCSVALFDFFFVPPRFSFTVADAQYIVTFAVMLIVTLIISHLAGGLKRQATEADERERQTRALYDFAKTLAGAPSVEQVVALARDWLRNNVAAERVLLVEGAADGAKLAGGDGQPPPQWLLLRSADVVMASGHRVATDQLGDDRCWSLLPLRTSARSYGVLAIAAPHRTRNLLDTHGSLLEALASVVTATLERLHYVDAAQSAQMRASTDRLRSSILSAISHDVRTPLTTLYGLADRLSTTRPPLSDSAHEAALAIRDQARRLSSMVSNLLDMSRLQSGEIRLRKEWQPLEEVVGASIQALGAALQDHSLKVELQPDLPLLQFDAVLMERVFANLIENAAKYSPAGSTIRIVARVADDAVETDVCDEGEGFPPDRVDHVFELFARGVPESSIPGMGVGLAICQAILEAHGGRIRAFNRNEGGACVSFTLPRGTPPVVELEANTHSAGRA